jgi:hypothetical protein
VLSPADIAAREFAMLIGFSISDIGRYPEPMERGWRLRHAIFVAGKVWRHLRWFDGLERNPLDDEQAIRHVHLREDEAIGRSRLHTAARKHHLGAGGPDAKSPETTTLPLRVGMARTSPTSDAAWLKHALGLAEARFACRGEWATVSFDWRLIVGAIQLRFFVSPLGFCRSLRMTQWLHRACPTKTRNADGDLCDAWMPRG